MAQPHRSPARADQGVIFALILLLALVHPHDCRLSTVPEFRRDEDSPIGVEADGAFVKTTCIF